MQRAMIGKYDKGVILRAKPEESLVRSFVRTSSVLRMTRFWFWIFSFGLFLIPPAQAASIKGKVLLDGQAPENPLINMDADPVCKSLNPGDVRVPKVAVNPDHTLQNVFVYIKGDVQGAASTPKAPAVLDQQGCNYHPHVLGIQTNQPLSIVNNDSTLHNVHALGQKNPEFNLGMPLQGM